MKKIAILGSTGSIGTQALEIIRQKNLEYTVTAISGNSNLELLCDQALEFKPKYVVAATDEGLNYLKGRLEIHDIKVLKGIDGLEHIATLPEVDIVLTSIVGMLGIKPTISAIRANKTIALANKETMVAAGDIINHELKKSNARILPVDSEHCALFQCLQGESRSTVRKLILTASGGPFRGRKKAELEHVTPEMALKHPKWNMGKKISIDSATLMNKALEVIEAHFLFETDYNNIDVVVHPQSIIHSMVEFVDGSVKAQLGNTNMKHPIQYAFEYPLRTTESAGYLDFGSVGALTFEKPDFDTFECLKLGYHAGITGGTMPAVLNAANEEAVAMFLDNRIQFLDIIELVRSAMEHHSAEYGVDIDRILEIEASTRSYVNSLI